MHLTELAFLIHYFISRSCALEYKWIEKSLPDGLTKEEKQFLLDVHNYYRRAAAQGGIIGRGPQAANMRELRWNEELAKDAQNWSAACKGGKHNKREERGYSGQNYAGIGYRPNTLKDAMTGWADEEAVYFQYDSKDYSVVPVVGHFTQIIWARSNEIGCGYSRCLGEALGRLVCHFMPSGNVKGHLAFESGPPCSKCDPGFGFCNDKLCARSCSGDKCTCTVDQQECKDSKGVFDHKKCLCRCPTGASGLNCENKCKDIISNACHPRYCVPRTKKYNQAEMLCPMSCRACEAVCEDKETVCHAYESGSCVNNFFYMKAYCPKTCNRCLKKQNCNETNFNCKSPELTKKCKTDFYDDRCQYYHVCCFRGKEANNSQAKRTPLVSISLLIPFLLSAIRYK